MRFKLQRVNFAGMPLPSQRILLVSERFLPHVGGIELHVAALAKALVRRGQQVEILTNTPGAPAHEGVAVHRFGVPTVPVVDIPFTPIGIGRLEALLRAGRYDVVHAHHSVVSPGVACAVYYAQRLRLRTVVTFHSLLRGYTPAFRALRALASWDQWPVSYTAVGSAVAADVGRLLGGRTVPLLPNGIDVREWAGIARTVDGPNVHLVATLRLAPRKRPLMLVQLMNDLRALPVRLTVAGDGPERAKVERAIERAELQQRITLAGNCSTQELRRLYGSAHAFVLPAREESFGLAALEARCSGLPVVALAATGVAQFITHERNGLLASSDADLIEQTRRLVLDAALRDRIAGTNRAEPAGFDWTEVVEQHLMVYQGQTAAALS